MTHDPKTETEAEAGQASGKTAEPPGAAWKSKRVQEEYQRALEHVVDKDFNLGMFFSLVAGYNNFCFFSMR